MIEIQQLKQVVLEQQAPRLPLQTLPRHQFAELKRLFSKEQVVIIMGMRRCGKSTLLQMLRQVTPEYQYYLNFDDERLVDFSLADFQTLHTLFIELYGEQKTFYFDEIQNILGWERFVRRLHDQGYKVCITGSNATLLSQELGTHLTGRYMPMTLYPLSFSEIMQTQLTAPEINKLTSQQQALYKRDFNDYFDSGGIPHYLQNPDETYLHTLYSDIVYRDIITRYKINKEKSLRELGVYLASNLGKDVSFNSLKKLINVTSTTTVSDYCSFLENSFLFFFINRYDPSLRKQMRANKKVYCVDLALARTIGFRFSEDYGRLLENLAYLALRQHYQDEIYYHREQYECDFVVRKGNQICHVLQVTQTLANEKTREREVNGLLEAMVQYQLNSGTILTETEIGTQTLHHEGKAYTVHIVPMWAWLLQGAES